MSPLISKIIRKFLTRMKDNRFSCMALKVTASLVTASKAQEEHQSLIYPLLKSKIIRGTRKRLLQQKNHRSILCSRFDHGWIVILVNIKPSILRFHQVAADWNISNSNMAAGTLPRNNVEDYRPCGNVSEAGAFSEGDHIVRHDNICHRK